LGENITMNDLNTSFLNGNLLPDVQGSEDSRALAIEQVGIRGIKQPVHIRSGASLFPTVASFDMDVALPADQKGTHMSRFVNLLQEECGAYDSQVLAELAKKMLPLLQAKQGRIQMQYTHFVKKCAPVSAVESWMDYDVTYLAQAKQSLDQEIEVDLYLKAVVPVMSLCPCSKEISEYGAHNQRSHVTILVKLDSDAQLGVEELVRIAETEASSELWAILKRPDEKWVTERAYENPKFVEDLVRDVAMRLKQDERILSLVVEAENFESIHNHSAFARISLP
jgi:GTP cyclohydrolase I